SGKDGIVKVSGFPPDSPIHVEVTDATGAIQFATDLTLARGVCSALIAPVAVAPGVFAGRVTDSAGAPLHDATVIVANAASDLQEETYQSLSPHMARTNKEGGFSL